MYRHAVPSSAALVLGLASAGCYGVIDGPVPGGSSATTPGNASASGGVAAVGSTSGVAATCTGAPTAAKPPLRRLTRREYNNTIRDLLGAAPLSIEELGIDESAHVFGTNTLTPITELQFNRYAETATLSAAGVCRTAHSESWASARCAAGQKPRTNSRPKFAHSATQEA